MSCCFDPSGRLLHPIHRVVPVATFSVSSRSEVQLQPAIIQQWYPLQRKRRRQYHRGILWKLFKNPMASLRILQNLPLRFDCQWCAHILSGTSVGDLIWWFGSHSTWLVFGGNNFVSQSVHFFMGSFELLNLFLPHVGFLVLLCFFDYVWIDYLFDGIDVITTDDFF